MLDQSFAILRVEEWQKRGNFLMFSMEDLQLNCIDIHSIILSVNCIKYNRLECEL